MKFEVYSDVIEIFENRPQQTIDWGVSLVQAPQVWNLTKGQGMKIAVLDTGVEYKHQCLSPNFVKGINFTTEQDNDHVDRQGHGSHVAGIISAADNGYGIIGVAPEAKIYNAKVLGDDGSGTIESVVNGIDWAIEEQVDIICMSLGINQNPGNEMHDAVKRARKAGIVMVAATGNDNAHCGWPAAYDEVIAVGAINQAMDRADFSNFGEEVYVSAPGVDILSTHLDNKYAKLSGTSMATPMVAGVIALIQAFTRKMGLKATPAKIKEMIETRSVDLGEEGRDDHFGNGLINVYRLLTHNNDNPQ